ncbi:MAG TPA: glycosyltransferase [Anaerolineales bacterium]|nr:glycosyltransferase [Anaerolineales bacterium]
MPTISIIIPCYNAEKTLGETLNSIVATTDYEVILVDDGSTDNSVFIAKSMLPEIHLIQQKNQGPAVARNSGISYAKGELIQFLDADDLLSKHKLQWQAEALVKHEADIAYGNWQRLRVQDDSGWQFAEVEEQEIREPVDLSAFTDFWCPPASFLFRREIVEKVGGFRADLPVIQDARFIQDCALAGAKFVKTPGISAFYRTHHSGSVSTRNRTAFLRDCLTNAQQICEIWRERGMLDIERKKAVLNCYGFVFKSAYQIRETKLALEAYQSAIKIDPNYLPSNSTIFRLAAKYFGVMFAEGLATFSRKIIP